jgi:hypothetical protein
LEGQPMNATQQSILDAALRLPEDDRLAIVKALLTTLAPDQEAGKTLVAHVEARLAEFAQLHIGTISHGDLKR